MLTSTCSYEIVMRLFQKTPSFKPFQTSHDTHLSLNGAKVTKFSLSYTRNGYTWIDLPTVYEATATLWIAKGPNGVGGRKTQRMFWQSLLLRGGIFLNHSPPPKKKQKTSPKSSPLEMWLHHFPKNFCGEVWKIMVTSPRAVFFLLSWGFPTARNH